MLVRQLQPTAQGMPIELYFFSANTAWVKYEALQAEVFDHLLATVHQFGLKVFQSPTGLDLRYLKQCCFEDVLSKDYNLLKNLSLSTMNRMCVPSPITSPLLSLA